MSHMVAYEGNIQLAGAPLTLPMSDAVGPCCRVWDGMFDRLDMVHAPQINVHIRLDDILFVAVPYALRYYEVGIGV